MKVQRNVLEVGDLARRRSDLVLGFDVLELEDAANYRQLCIMSGYI